MKLFLFKLFIALYCYIILIIITQYMNKVSYELTSIHKDIQRKLEYSKMYETQNNNQNR